MNKFKVGDKVIRTTGSSILSIGKKYIVKEVRVEGISLKGYGDKLFNSSYFKLVEDASKHHTHHDLIIAWAKGAEIETSIKGRWRSLNHPDWNINYVYRIKPEPSPEKEELKNIIADMKEQLANATKRLEELS